MAQARVPALLEAAQRQVAPLVEQVEGLGDDGQRVAFAVSRLADALAEGRKHHPTAPADDRSTPRAPPADATRATPDDTESRAAGTARQRPEGSRVDHGAEAVQVGVATSLAIVGGELLSPSRWYWAVIAAFVVFAGTPAAATC